MKHSKFIIVNIVWAILTLSLTILWKMEECEAKENFDWVMSLQRRLHRRDFIVKNWWLNNTLKDDYYKYYVETRNDSDT